MFDVQLALHAGRTSWFQMPWRLAGCVPGRELEISRYRPY